MMRSVHNCYLPEQINDVLTKKRKVLKKIKIAYLIFDSTTKMVSSFLKENHYLFYIFYIVKETC